MKIKKLYLTNFRSFENRHFSFDDRLTLIIGENGTGKTSVLEGLSVALGGWLCGFDGLDDQDKRDIAGADIRIVLESAHCAPIAQLPVEVRCEASFPEEGTISWSRGLESLEGGDIGSRDVGLRGAGLQELRKISDKYNRKILACEDSSVILPLIGCYRAGRMMEKHANKRQVKQRDGRRLDGYRTSISDPIADTMDFLDRLASSALRDGDEKAKAKLNLIVSALKAILEPMIPGVEISYSVDAADFLVRNQAGEARPVSLLSGGYRRVVGIVMDICRRIIELNPQLGEDAIIKTYGVVLIEEVELHLHPKWQQRILVDLLNVFPKLQFVATTNSPVVIQSVREKSLMILDDENAYYPVPNYYGWDASAIMTCVMEVPEHPEEVEEMLDGIYADIDGGELVAARKKTDELERVVGQNYPELTGIRISIDLEALEKWE
ncbi:MAG: AAA family ATPase [Clostridiales bacterium]|jgi:predicted ATP-binding protein involved in virulence|nr:AAA family ATPase [Clostridiales bacterium]